MKQKEAQKFKASSFSSTSTKQKKIKKKKLPQSMKQYLLQDYTFLNEYQLLDSPINSESQFLARIKTTQQFVKFKKIPFITIDTVRGETMYKRFQVMHALFQKGIILADNIFILYQANKQYFYYIIEPYLLSKQVDSPFLTLQQYLFENRLSLDQFQTKKNLFIKCKNLLDNLSLYQQAYRGLNSRKIVIDDQGSAFLLPFQLQTQVVNKPYQRSYYPIEVLQFLQQQQNQLSMGSMHKWDVWSFGCITLDIFLYVTPYFLSTSIEKQTHKTNKLTRNVFKDFQAQYINQSQKQSQNSNQDKQKILNFLMNAFHQDENKRQFSFQPIFNEAQTFKTQRSRRTSRVKSTTRRLFQKTMQKSKDKFESRTQRTSYKQTIVQSSRISHFFQQQTTNLRQLNICQKISNNKIKKTQNNEFYTLEIKLKSLILQSIPIVKQKQTKQIKILINFYNGQKFQFFINLKNENQQPQIPISRKITFANKQLQFIDDFLEQDIQILLSVQDSEGKQAEILLNLSSLTIKNQFGQRMWKKPIKGTYLNQNGSHFKCKIKIQAQITENDPIQNKVKNGSHFIKQKIGDKPFQSRRIERKPSENPSQKQTQKDQNSQRQKLSSKFEKSLQQISIQQKSRKSSLLKFSQINSQLDEISTYWKQKASIDLQQKIYSLEDIIDTNQKKQQKSNVLRETKIDLNSKIFQNIQSQEGKNLQSKVKKILQQNKKPQKFTETMDLTKKLKRLFMK